MGEYSGNLVINWKNNTITFILAGSDTYKIIKEAKDVKNSSIILTARKNFYGDVYTEFKIFSNPSGDFFRAWDKDTNEYQYQPARLSCWNEEKIP